MTCTLEILSFCPLQVVIDCMVKAYLCQETKSDVWGQVQLAELELLTHRGLEWYSEFIPDEEDSYDECLSRFYKQ